MTFKEYCIENNLLDFLNEWSDKNGNLTPANVLTTSRANVWWQCKCGHSWNATVSHRVLGQGCPKCSNTNKIVFSRTEPKVNLVGQRFGKLLVEKYCRTDPEALWECICDCGNTVVVRHNSLTSGKTKSCGCIQDAVRRKNFENSIHFVDGTCVERIAAKITPKNNTSGFRGVSMRENGSYRVGITFKGKRYELGTYKTLEEAIEARLAGEVMFDEFVDSFRKSIAK